MCNSKKKYVYFSSKFKECDYMTIYNGNHVSLWNKYKQQLPTKTNSEFTSNEILQVVLCYFIGEFDPDFKITSFYTYPGDEHPEEKYTDEQLSLFLGAKNRPMPTFCQLDYSIESSKKESKLEKGKKQRAIDPELEIDFSIHVEEENRGKKEFLKQSEIHFKNNCGKLVPSEDNMVFTLTRDSYLGKTSNFETESFETEIEKIPEENKKERSKIFLKKKNNSGKTKKNIKKNENINLNFSSKRGKKVIYKKEKKIIIIKKEIEIFNKEKIKPEILHTEERYIVGKEEIKNKNEKEMVDKKLLKGNKEQLERKDKGKEKKRLLKGNKEQLERKDKGKEKKRDTSKVTKGIIDKNKINKIKQINKKNKVKEQEIEREKKITIEKRKKYFLFDNYKYEYLSQKYVEKYLSDCRFNKERVIAYLSVDSKIFPEIQVLKNSTDLVLRKICLNIKNLYQEDGFVPQFEQMYDCGFLNEYLRYENYKIFKNTSEKRTQAIYMVMFVLRIIDFFGKQLGKHIKPDTHTFNDLLGYFVVYVIHLKITLRSLNTFIKEYSRGKQEEFQLFI